MGSHYSDAYDHDAEKAREAEKTKFNNYQMKDSDVPKHMGTGIGKTIVFLEGEEEFKRELRFAYEAGMDSVFQNKDRDERLEKGVKQIEQEYNFENWYFNKGMKQEYFRKYQLIAEAGFAPTDHDTTYERRKTMAKMVGFDTELLKTGEVDSQGDIIPKDAKITIGIDLAHNEGDKMNEAIMFYNADNSITFVKGSLKGQTFPVEEALKLHDKEKEKLKPYEEKFIVEINKTERVKLDDFRFKDEHIKIYYCKNAGNDWAMVYDTDPNKALLFDTYQEAQEKLIYEIGSAYSRNKHFSGSVNKVIVPRKNDLEKDYSIGETVISCREGWNLETSGKETEIIAFGVFGSSQICVKNKKDSSDWYWTNHFKKLEK